MLGFTKEPTRLERKTDAKVVAEGGTDDKAHKGNIADSNENACDCDI